MPGRQGGWQRPIDRPERLFLALFLVALAAWAASGLPALCAAALPAARGLAALIGVRGSRFFRGG